MTAADLRSAQPIQASPSVSVVIVTYRGVGFVSACLDHVGAQTFADAEVVLVENGSNDGTAEMVREHYPWVRLVVSETNTGFTGGVNLGVANARADRIALLNNDGHPEPRWLEELVGLSTRFDRADLASSVIKNVGMGDLEDRFGWTLNVLGRSHRHPLTPADFLFFGAGAGMLFSKNEYNPPFPEFYFIYNEDTYLGWLARLRGHQVNVALKSRVIHEGSATMKKMHAVGAFHGEKNRMTNNLIFWERRTLYRLSPLLAFDVLFHFRRYPLPLARALAWVVANRKSIRRMRSEIQGSRKVPDAEILRFVSSQVKHGAGRGARLANAFSAAYCKAFGITTLEASNPFGGGSPAEPAARPSGAPLA
jgi:N-acetylglucosaminyl-diphospho-decaprenol L-rhamnosyltransferase